MRHLLLTCLTLATLAAPAFAKAPNEANVFAWEATPPGGGAPNLLVGTMHVALEDGKELPAAVTSRIAHATRFAMEVDLEHVAPGDVMRYASQAPGQPDLKHQLSAARWKKLVSMAKAKGLDEERLNHMAPWLVSMMFLDVGPSGANMMDERLRAEADHDHVPLTFLETADEQFKTLAAVSPKENIAQLGEMLDDPKQPQRELDDLEKAYRHGNLAEIQTLVLGADRVKEYPDFYKRLFWDRNARWEPEVDAMFKPGGAVLAVGLGHMLGDRGMVARLTRRGYKVAPLAL